MANTVFIVTKGGGHPAFAIEQEEVRIATEQFCDEGDRPVPAGKVEANDPVAGHVLKAVDARALDACPEQLTKGGRGWWIGQMLMNEMDTSRVIPQGAEQAARMSRDTNFQDQGVGERLRDFLDPPLGQSRR